MKVAYDAGVNFFDTAEVYSGGQSEIVLGEAIKKFGWKQNDLVISTKVSKIFLRYCYAISSNTNIFPRSTGARPTAPTRTNYLTTMDSRASIS